MWECQWFVEGAEWSCSVADVVVVICCEMLRRVARFLHEDLIKRANKSEPQAIWRPTLPQTLRTQLHF